MPSGVNIYKALSIPAVSWINGDPPYSFDTFSILGSNVSGSIVGTGIRHARSSISFIIGVPITLSIWGATGTLPEVHLIDSLFANASLNTSINNNGVTLIPTVTDSGYIEIYYASANLGWAFNCEITSYSYTLEINGYAQTLRSYLENLLGNAGLMNTPYGTGKVKSTFLWNDALPSTGQPPTIATFIGSHPTWNYNTGILSELNNMILSCRAAWSTGNPTTAFYFRDFMGCLNAFWDVFWYIDNDGNFRIEHEYWFEDLRTLELDLTDSSFIPYKVEVDLKSYSFRKDILAWHEHWAINYNVNVDFIGCDIIYNIYATSQVTKERRYGVMSTDIAYLQTAPLIDSLDGMVLTNCDYLGPNSYGEKAEVGKITGASQRNGHMAQANLIDKYWRKQRYSINATACWGTLTIDSALPQILQEVKFPYTSDLSYYQSIKVSFGNGMISEDTHDLASDFHDVKIYLNAY